MSPDAARALTLGVLILLAVALALYDVAIVWAAGPRASLSVVLFEESRKHPFAAIALGILIGHVFWPNGAR